ncbi:MAG: MBOAT family O-acyltransferase [Leptospiraceae bacterium]
MLFNSLTFVVFLAIVIGLYYMVRPWPMRKGILLVASYAFYAAWNPPFVLLLWGSTLVDWYVAKGIAATRNQSKKRVLVVISLITNLGLLAFFKYGGFLLSNMTALLGTAGIEYEAAAPSIILPVGISFYTFQTLSYTLDVYRGKIQPSSSWLNFALYVTFFPQLVAGPIVRAGQFLPQAREEKRATSTQLLWGLYLITLGLFQKMVMADTMLAPAADTVFGRPGPVAVMDAWVGVLAFGGQIFADFAGYSVVAIGTALCLGFQLPDNFRSPYGALGFSDFWRRWHITLSTWLRDYLYIPLGGNRKGVLRTLPNLLITMFLGGLWHGAAWTFVAWGLVHGLFLVIERLLVRGLGSLAVWQKSPVRIGLMLLTFVLVSLTWVFFRSPDFEKAILIFLSLFSIISDGPAFLPTVEILKVALVIIPLVVGHIWLRDKTLGEVVQSWPLPVFVAIWTFMLITIILSQGAGDAFIYFRF